jgi:hypothetical protein
VARAGLWLGIFVGLGLVAWRFAARHAGIVTIDLWLLRWEEVPLWLALVVAFGAGAASIGLVASYGAIRAWLTERRYRRTLAGLESEIHQLRNLPLAPEGSAGRPAAASRTEGAGARGESLPGSA